MKFDYEICKEIIKDFIGLIAFTPLTFQIVVFNAFFRR